MGCNPIIERKLINCEMGILLLLYDIDTNNFKRFSLEN